MEFRILGPLEVREDGQTVELGGAKQRALLAMLLLSAGEVVSADRLIDYLWGEQPPASALNSVHIYVSQLRKILGSECVVTRGRGYAAAIDPSQLDLRRFEQLVTEGRELSAAGRPAQAAQVLRSALALWRGRPLADLDSEAAVQGELHRLEELRLAAVEELIDADLAVGRHAELVSELETLVREHPLRERLRAQLMLALYRSGRQAEALEAYRNARRMFVSELGLEPGRSLQELERSILSHDPSLDSPVEAGGTAEVRRRRGLFALAAAAVLLLAVGGVVLRETRRHGAAGLTSVSPNAVGVISPKTNQIVAQIPVGGRPAAIVAGLGSVWVADHDNGTVLRIDPTTRRVVRAVGLGIDVAELVVGAGSIWVAGGNDSVVVRLNRQGEIQARIHFPPLPVLGANPVQAVTVGAGSIWAVSDAGVSRIDERTNSIARPINIGEVPVPVFDAAATAHAIWVVVRNNQLVKVVPELRSRAATLRLGEFLNHITAGDGSVWVADDNPEPGTIWQVSTTTSRAIGSVRAGREPFGVAVGERALWSANALDGTISRIDPATHRVDARVRLGHNPIAIAVGYGSVWVGVAASPPFSH